MNPDDMTCQRCGDTNGHYDDTGVCGNCAHCDSIDDVTCDTCGQTVAAAYACWHMATPVCPACFHIANGDPVCGACSPDMGDSLDAWPDAASTGETLEPCTVCQAVKA